MYSGIYTLTTKPDKTQGYVILGTVDDLLFAHYAPNVVPPADAVPVYAPNKPFRWDDFAEEFPELAASPGTDAEGEPLPPVLMRHGWMGE